MPACMSAIWRDERNCYKWDQSVAVEPNGTSSPSFRPARITPTSERSYCDEVCASTFGTMYTEAAFDALPPCCSTSNAHMGNCEEPTSLNIFSTSPSTAIASSLATE